MHRVLCIWLPEWPIQRLVVAKQELSSKQTSGNNLSDPLRPPQPLVLHARDPRRGQLVVACCSRSNELGIRKGMPIAEVAALQRNLTQTNVSVRDSSLSIALEEHAPTLDLETLSQLAIWCEQFSPIVGIENSDQLGETPSSLLLDITGLGVIFGSENKLVDLIHRAFAERGYRIRVGVGNTVGAAWALAHYQARKPESGNCVQIGTDGHTEQPLKSLGPLPVAALRLPSQTLDTLYQLGIETITQLMQLPRDGLATRLGETLIQRLDQAFGNQTEVIIAHRPRPDFEASFLFEHPTNRRNVIEAALEQLVNSVSLLLEQCDHAAVQVEAKLFGQQTKQRLFVSLFQPTNNPKHILNLLKLQLDTSEMREKVKKIHLAAVTTVRVTGQQYVLWDEVGYGIAQRDSELAQLVDRLSSRLGKECVFGVQAQAGALPEEAYRKKLLTETVKSKRGAKQIGLRQRKTANTLRAPHRPLWLHEPQPLQLTERTSHPRKTDKSSLPNCFQVRNEHHEVASYWGPERIETGWWSGQSIRRDYYRVETTNGSRFWLFCQLGTSVWYLHGSFE